MKPKISIITIVFNRKKDLRKTLESIKSQTFESKQFVVIDGGSTDGTKDILEEYNEIIDILVSEPDKGIYDAMNKGVSMSEGEWLNFMNAGDTYINKNTLEDVFLRESQDDDMLIGNTLIDYGNFKKSLKVKSLDKIWMGARFIHQSVIIKREYQLRNPYNIQNKIGGDFEFFYNAIQKDASIKILDQYISIFEAGGVSDTNRTSSILGNMRIVLKDDPSLTKFLFYILKLSFETLKSTIKIFLPKNLIRIFQRI